jgi:hypothetical protein
MTHTWRTKGIFKYVHIWVHVHIWDHVPVRDDCVNAERKGTGGGRRVGQGWGGGKRERERERGSEFSRQDASIVMHAN